jgi:hypothetical protein
MTTNTVWWEMCKETEPGQTVERPGRPEKPFEGLRKYVRILNTLDIASSHRMFHVVYKLLPIPP